MLKTARYWKLFDNFFSSFFDLLLLEFDFFFDLFYLFFGLFLLQLVLFLPVLHWIINCPVNLVFVVCESIHCMLIPTNIVPTFQPPLYYRLDLTTLFPCTWIVHVGHFDGSQDPTVFENYFVLSLWFDAFATATSQFIAHLIIIYLLESLLI